MRRPIVIEAGAPADGSPGMGFRFTCAKCRLEGAWHASLNDAEDSARRHNRQHHQDDEVARA